MIRLTLVLLLACSLFAAACDDDPATTIDAAAGDSLTADSYVSPDGLTADAPGADAQQGDAQQGDATPADGPVADAGAPTKTPCGTSLQCDSLTEVCVVNQAQLKTYVCKAVPTACDKQRTCACLGATVCTGIFTACTDNPASNTVNCDCPNC